MTHSIHYIADRLDIDRPKIGRFRLAKDNMWLGLLNLFQLDAVFVAFNHSLRITRAAPSTTRKILAPSRTMIFQCNGRSLRKVRWLNKLSVSGNIRVTES